MTSKKSASRALRVLVTRPSHQARALSEGLQSLGHIPLPLPLLAIRPIAGERERAALARQIQELDRYQLLIFVSSNAVRLGADLIDDYWPQFPADVELLAIGPSTAEMASERFQRSVHQPEQGMNSEAFLELPLLRDVEGQRVAILRGRGGRELMAAQLRERGAEVSYIELYERTPVTYEGDRLGELLDNPGIDVLTVTSGQSLEQLSLLGERNKARLCLIPLIVPSSRVAEQAGEAGFQQVIDAGGASEDLILAAVQALAAGAAGGP